MKPLLILLLLAFIFPAHAQHLSSGTRHSAMKYVYPLAEKDARVLYKKGIHHLKESMLSEPADSFLFEQQYAFHLMKPGAYIIAYAEGENLVTEMVQHSFLHPMFVQQGKKSILFLSDIYLPERQYQEPYAQDIQPRVFILGVLPHKRAHDDRDGDDDR